MTSKYYIQKENVVFPDKEGSAFDLTKIAGLKAEHPSLPTQVYAYYRGELKTRALDLAEMFFGVIKRAQRQEFTFKIPVEIKGQRYFLTLRESLVELGKFNPQTHHLIEVIVGQNQEYAPVFDCTAVFDRKSGKLKKCLSISFNDATRCVELYEDWSNLLDQIIKAIEEGPKTWGGSFYF